MEKYSPYYKYIPYVLIIILAFALLFKCESSKELVYENKELKKENVILEEKKNQVKILIKNHYDTITKIEVKIKTNTIIVEAKVDSIKELNTNGLANAYRKRYNVNKEVISSNLGVILNDSVAKLSLTDHARYDNCLVENRFKDDIISNHIKIEAKKDTLLLISEDQNKNLVNMNKNTESLYKKEKNKNLGQKIIIGALAIIATVELAVIITK